MKIKKSKILQALSKKERDRSSTTQVYLVWYEDRFSGDPAFVVSIFLDKKDAQREVAKRPLQNAGQLWDGYSFDGPHNLLRAYDRGMLAGANKTAEELVRAALAMRSDDSLPIKQSWFARFRHKLGAVFGRR